MVLASIEVESSQLGVGVGLDVAFVLQATEIMLNEKGEFHLIGGSFILVIH